MRGCLHSCAFCCFSAEPYWNERDPDSVALDLKELSHRHRTSVFMFLNTQINPTQEYAERIADAFIRHDLNIRWSDCCTPTPLNPSLLRRLREAGAVKLSLGFEIGSERMARMIRKPVRVARMGEVLKIIFDAGMWAHLHLICGFPHEQKEDVEATVDFLETNQWHIMSTHVNRFFLDGEYLVAPEEMQIKLRLDQDAFHQGSSTMRFDEVGGRKWEEIVPATEASYERIWEVMVKLFGSTPHLEETVEYMESAELSDLKNVQPWMQRLPAA